MASHLPTLVRAYDISKGDILELGTGYFSTLMLDWLSAITDRKVVSYETNPDWYARAKKLQSSYHDVIFVESWDKFLLKKNIGAWLLSIVIPTPVVPPPSKD